MNTSILDVFSSDSHTRCATLKTLASNPQTNFEVTDKKGENVFHKCANTKSVRRLDAILEGFKTLQTPNPSLTKAINAINNSGRHPLYIAARNNTCGVAKKLLKMGADPANANSLGKLPEVRATKEKMRSLLKNARLEQGGLLVILKEGDYIKALQQLNNGVNVALTDTMDNNPMLLAIKSGIETHKPEAEILNLLKKLHAMQNDVNHQNNLGETVLQLCVKHGFKEIVTFLLFEAKADACIKDQFDNTILHTAAKENAKIEIVKELLKSDAKNLINEPNSDEQVPLHLVTNAKMARLLCRTGASTNVKDKEERTPADYFLNLPKRQELLDVMHQFNPEKDLKEKEDEIPVHKTRWKKAAKTSGKVAVVVAKHSASTIGTFAGAAVKAYSENSKK